ncbi:hypothetical protein HA48_14710 [Pantoea wallisii]|uniref:Uncharacterized protein n=1 Tax=Pantoea wallisii TaxID=1076551 RepID=A0A1X1D6X2_9GAMM|nr:hypothetical protein [Pantoea wallisii]ORM72404.1 hypothetical protein HA48_14710 [Pantoea wallisii]
MQFATAGAAHLGSSSINTSVSSQFAFKLTGAEVMHWQPKSRLQQLWERLVQVITQEGQP